MARSKLKPVEDIGSELQISRSALDQIEHQYRVRARIDAIQQRQKANREARDAKRNEPVKYSEVDDGRGIKSRDALIPGRRVSYGIPVSLGKTRGSSKPKPSTEVVKFQGGLAKEAEELGGTYGDFSPDEETLEQKLKPWEPVKGKGGSYSAAFQSREFKEQWFKDQMEELGFIYDPKAIYKSRDPRYDQAFHLAKSNWSHMNAEWNKKFNEAKKLASNQKMTPVTPSGEATSDPEVPIETPSLPSAPKPVAVSDVPSINGLSVRFGADNTNTYTYTKGSTSVSVTADPNNRNAFDAVTSFAQSQNKPKPSGTVRVRTQSGNIITGTRTGDHTIFTFGDPNPIKDKGALSWTI